LQSSSALETRPQIKLLMAVRRHRHPARPQNRNVVVACRLGLHRHLDHVLRHTASGIEHVCASAFGFTVPVTITILASDGHGKSATINEAARLTIQ
jgi:hypothetical protein